MFRPVYQKVLSSVIFLLLLSLTLDAGTLGAGASNVASGVILGGQPSSTLAPQAFLTPLPAEQVLTVLARGPTLAPPVSPPSQTATLASSETPLPTSTPTASVAVPDVPIASATPLPSPTPTSTWIWAGAGQIIVPILLYHHIAEITPSNRYYVSPANFEDQMNLPHRWGYTTILPTLLAQAITTGAELPERPFIILEKAVKYGYKAAMGLGPTTTHGRGTLCYLNRWEVYGDLSLQEFAEILPWQQP